MLIARTEAKMEAGGICREFYICDEIMADYQRFNWRTYEYETVESKTSQRYFVENLKGLGPGDKVNLYINSMGGSVKEALGIYNVLQRCPAKVTAYIDGFAASAASVIAMAAETVVMPRNTAMMIHNAAWWAYGNPEALRKSADDLEVINMAAIQSYVVHAGDKLDRDRLQQMLDEETWLTAEECVACGLADQFAEQEVDVQTAAQQYQAAAAAAKDREAAMYRKPPAFLAGVLPAEAEPSQDKKEDSKVKSSSIYLLLKNITKNMEE